ncbi:flagellar hook-associated protein FlgL [Bacillus sp. B15-48]|uniref:flagellar hook-associated protein FlgL n=1 Tax=Bacillus sp. B15-48 TaxID=1548601 RepID=UPI00193F5C83|nr:flagellar hook-associated protein FlgL [Bacillus sp. B15-48]MBM4764121.1 flagellar hook-associated protein 3 [Bacillus sp. B15-48]
MRVTQLMATRQFNQNLHRTNQEMNTLYQQISSGEKFEKISDNPLEVMKAMAQRTNLIQTEQYQKNVQAARDRLTAVDDVLSNATNVMQRVRELTIKASNDTNTETDRKSIAVEMTALKEQLGTLANTTFNGRYLFAGADQNTPSYQDGMLQSVGGSPMNWEIGKGITINVNVNANTVFGFAPEGENLFETLDDLVLTLENGENPNEFLSTIDKQMDYISMQHATVGANVNMLEMTANKLDQANFLTQKVLTETEGTDIAKAYMDLVTQETTLNASLAVGSRSMQQSLVDFLR